MHVPCQRIETVGSVKCHDLNRFHNYKSTRAARLRFLGWNLLYFVSACDCCAYRLSECPRRVDAGNLSTVAQIKLPTSGRVVPDQKQSRRDRRHELRKSAKSA